MILLCSWGTEVVGTVAVPSSISSDWPSSLGGSPSSLIHIGPWSSTSGPGIGDLNIFIMASADWDRNFGDRNRKFGNGPPLRKWPGKIESKQIKSRSKSDQKHWKKQSKAYQKQFKNISKTIKYKSMPNPNQIQATDLKWIPIWTLSQCGTQHLDWPSCRDQQARQQNGECDWPMKAFGAADPQWYLNDSTLETIWKHKWKSSGKSLKYHWKSELNQNKIWIKSETIMKQVA